MCPHLGSLNLDLISGCKHISQSLMGFFWVRLAISLVFDRVRTPSPSSSKSGRQHAASKLRIWWSSVPHGRIVVSPPPLANLPSSNTTTAFIFIILLCSVRVFNSSPVVVFHSLIVSSSEPLTSVPSANTTKAFTQPVWPISVLTTSPVVVFHSIIVSSHEPLASVPSCSTASELTLSMCPVSVYTIRRL